MRSGQIARSAFTARSEIPLTVTNLSSRDLAKPPPMKRPATMIPKARIAGLIRSRSRDTLTSSMHSPFRLPFKRKKLPSAGVCRTRDGPSYIVNVLRGRGVNDYIPSPCSRTEAKRKLNESLQIRAHPDFRSAVRRLHSSANQRAVTRRAGSCDADDRHDYSV